MSGRSPVTGASEAPVFRAIFDSSLDAILLTAPDGRILAANPAAETMFGRTEAEIMRGGRELLVDLSDPRLGEAIRERERVGRYRGDLRFLRGDGSSFEGEASSVVFDDADGEPRTAMVIHDISERTAALQRVRESEGRFQALAEAAFEGIVIHDAGRILDVNPAACTLFGYSEEALRTMSVVELVPGDEAAAVRSLIDQGGVEHPYETRALTADGGVRAIEVSARPISYEGRPARVAAVRDVTERLRAARALEELNLRLRELDALKSEFVALVSHELRTPLTSIIAHVAVLEAGEAGPVDEQQRRYLDVVGRNAERLRRLVDDLLFVARAETGEFALECTPVELTPVAEEAVATWQSCAARAGVALAARLDATPVVLADRDRLLQLLDNLVGNAIKFTPSGGSIEVRVGAGPDGATLAVADTGLGIPVEDRDAVFERFYRGSRAVSGAVAGAGLGLAIVREIVAAHGGSVGLISEVGRGTTFTVTLPFAS